MEGGRITILVSGAVRALLPAISAAGWSITCDPDLRHALVLLGVAAGDVAARRPRSTAPLLVGLPPLSTSAERTIAFAAGADDVLPDGCAPEEVVARIGALLRRGGPGAAPIRCGDLAIDPLARRATREGAVLPLLPREYALLSHLADRQGRTVSRTDLLRGVWRLPFDPGTNVVEAHMSRLRAKLDRGYVHPLLHTVRGRGYVLAESRPAD